MGSLEVKNLTRPGLQKISVQIGAGECLAVTGPSGSGKTLFLRALADLDPSEGAVILDGRDRTDTPAPQWRREIIYVPAEPGWWAETTAEHFSNWDRAEPIAAALLLPIDVADAPVSRLSTGERQRLALARALELAPRVLLLDEPTGPLDAAATDAVESVLRQRLDTGMTLVLATHDEAQATRFANQRLRLRADQEAAASP
ncbi:MAG: ATP-binding cassette domain-containing protein [Rhodospirillaceae bacterium]|jgi:phosphate-transporting ATPase|nr:ATP-binding cassette domain-containing protein [Rhodospirillaceae bacterium]MBT5665773.1 ATP-binding cassette domain-containing protein [Rhodospirillaceae bacterium]MBT5811310.1 ATP-binding cassette domain-containing protein [Rhodospirillaceae bacterium]